MIIFEYGLPYTKFFVYADNYFVVNNIVCVRYNTHSLFCLEVI
jgi:hypothetical protein